ncbi:MAG: DUF5020 family protein [Bacteroidota bacterium]|nr:DUF5020 family protein [Bacteroidota bacterium]
MKKFILLSVILIASISMFAQNVQLHRDFGKDRNYFTTTVEMFKPDKLGNTFFFIDMNYGDGDVEGVSLAYWEISRCIKFGETPLSFHAEYDGGFGQWKDGDIGGTFQINNAWLGGIDYSWNNEDFSKGFSIKTLYKYIQGKHDATFQLTAVWHANFFDNKLSFTGFADFWREDSTFGTNDTKYVFLSEPQLWYNYNEHLALGTELELSSNFGTEGFDIMPTLAAKWAF